MRRELGPGGENRGGKTVRFWKLLKDDDGKDRKDLKKREACDEVDGPLTLGLAFDWVAQWCPTFSLTHVLQDGIRLFFGEKDGNRGGEKRVKKLKEKRTCRQSFV